MQTRFSEAQLADPAIAEADAILRKCVHCGFCLATCPTYTLLGDERDSPRGRIYLIKEMLEADAPADARVATHIDRCLSCLACMSTCPSGVDYMHLVDLARVRIEATHRRPWAERALRALLPAVLTRPRLARLALLAGSWMRPLLRRLPGQAGAWGRLAPASLPAPSALDRPQVVPAEGRRRMRVALLTGCVQPALRPAINDASVRLLTRLGCEVIVPRGLGCCGALSHHLGREEAGKALAAANLAALAPLLAGGLDAVIANASGCGTMLKDYGHLFARDHDLERRALAARVAGLARDVSEVVEALGLPAPLAFARPRLVYQSPCSLQHGQRIRALPRSLLEQAGFAVAEPQDAHLCCGSAGTYNLLQPELAATLGGRKAAALAATEASAVATGNIGCLAQLAQHTRLPVAHTVEFLDWATGGPAPPGIAG